MFLSVFQGFSSVETHWERSCTISKILAFANVRGSSSEKSEIVEHRTCSSIFMDLSSFLLLRKRGINFTIQVHLQCFQNVNGQKKEKEYMTR